MERELDQNQRAIDSMGDEMRDAAQQTDKFGDEIDDAADKTDKASGKLEKVAPSSKAWRSRRVPLLPPPAPPSPG